jgi:uncharacterized membrane protein
MAERVQENVAGLLCYSVGWLTGLIFLLIDKRSAVRFHAAQSIVVFGGLQVISMIVSRMPLSAVVGFLLEAVDLVGIVLWIVLMVKTYQGVKVALPIAGNIAERLARTS